jgi:mitochondrial fission protein ELM1
MPRVWALLGERTGDNNQVLALCEALGLPFETRTLHYNILRAVHARILGATIAALTLASRRTIRPPWPDLIIAIGRRSVPVARWIRRASGNRTRIVLLGNPRVDPAIFDLVITTRQYPVPSSGNVLLLPLAMTRFPDLPQPDAEEQAILSALPRPHLLMAIGGATKYWKLEPSCIREALDRLSARATDKGGSLIVVGSRRTDPNVAQALRDAVTGEHRFYVDDATPRFPVLLRDADEIFVTGDSISMLSEAIQAGKPVGMIPIRQTSKGRRKLGAQPGRESGGRRDLRRFWSHLQERGLIGTIEQPASGPFANPSETARDAVLELLGDAD